MRPDAPKAPARLTIGTLSARTGGHIETIRYYERIGLMPLAARSDGGHRLYGEEHVKRLGFIRRSRELGFTLDQIRTLLRLVDGRRYTCAQTQDVKRRSPSSARFGTTSVGRRRAGDRSARAGWPSVRTSNNQPAPLPGASRCRG